MKRIAIATPTYNEANNIKKLIPALDKVVATMPRLEFSLLIIDDSSPDGTALVAKKLAKKIKAPNFTVNVLERKQKDGFGRAYMAGFNKLLKQKFDYIIQMDADLSHNPIYLKNFIEEISAGRDFVVGSRYVKGGGTPNWGIHRKILSRGGNVYSSIILSRKIRDYTGGYNMFSAELLKQVNIDSLSSSGYGFLIELKYRALLKSKSVSQIPIIFTDRVAGESKIPKSTLLKNLLLVPRLKIHRFRKKF